VINADVRNLDGDRIEITHHHFQVKQTIVFGQRIFQNVSEGCERTRMERIHGAIEILEKFDPNMFADRGIRIQHMRE